MRVPPKSRCFWPVLATLLLADCSTKELVVGAFARHPGPHPLLGSLLRITLNWNPDAAFSLSFGGASRFVFGGLALAAIAILYRLYRRTAPDARLRATAIALVLGGALGNLVDRVRSARDVVDFIDVGIGPARFWTFNLADLGVTTGALLLAVMLWREDRTG